jgi:hypothetical protein
MFTNYSLSRFEMSARTIKAAHRAWNAITSERATWVVEMGAAISTIANDEKGQPGPVGGDPKKKEKKRKIEPQIAFFCFCVFCYMRTII